MQTRLFRAPPALCCEYGAWAKVAERLNVGIMKVDAHTGAQAGDGLGWRRASASALNFGTFTKAAMCILQMAYSYKW